MSPPRRDWHHFERNASVFIINCSALLLPFFQFKSDYFLSSDYSMTSTWKLWRDLDDTTVDDSHRCSSPLNPCDLPKRYSSFRNSCNSHSHSGAQSFASSPSLNKRAHFHFLSNSLSSLLFDVWFPLCVPLIVVSCRFQSIFIAYFLLSLFCNGYKIVSRFWSTSSLKSCNNTHF